MTDGQIPCYYIQKNDTQLSGYQDEVTGAFESAKKHEMPDLDKLPLRDEVKYKTYQPAKNKKSSWTYEQRKQAYLNTSPLNAGRKCEPWC